MNYEEIFWLLNDLRMGCQETDKHYTHEIGAFTSSIDELRSRRRNDYIDDAHTVKYKYL